MSSVVDLMVADSQGELHMVIKGYRLGDGLLRTEPASAIKWLVEVRLLFASKVKLFPISVSVEVSGGRAVIRPDNEYTAVLLEREFIVTQKEEENL
jgi:hypothetical protein